MLPFTLYLSLAVAQEKGARGNAEVGITNILLLSGDSAVIKTTRESMNFKSLPFSEVEKRFPAKRFYVGRWGEDRLVVIDNRIGPLSVHVNRTRALEAVERKLGPDRLLHFGDLSRDDQGAIGNVLVGFSQDPKTQKPIYPRELGADVMLGFKVQSGGKSMALGFPINDAGRKAVMKSLNEDLKSELTEQANGGGGRANPPVPDEVPTNVPMEMIGSEVSKNLPEGMKIAPSLIDAAVKELVEKEKAACSRVLDKIGMPGKEIPNGPLRLDQIPKDLRDKMEDTFANSWQGRGFASRQEAELFFRNCDSVSIATHLALIQVVSPGDANHAIYTNVTLVSSRSGGIWP